MQDHHTEATAAASELEMFQCPEALHPDLQPYFVDGPVGKMLHHRFVINVMTIPGRHKADNTMYLHRKDEAERSWLEKDWRRYIACHERPYRAEALQRVLAEGCLPLEQPATWQLIKAVWIDSENVDEHNKFWTTIWEKASLEMTLDLGERSAFDKLPDPGLLPVFRTRG